MQSDGGSEEEEERGAFAGSCWSIYDNREVLQRYEILDHIGSGAYSDVYHAKRRQDGIHVALKEVHDHKSSVRELQALSLLRGQSDAVVQLLDHFWQDPGILLVLEFLPDSLSEIIDKRKGRPMPDSEARKWMTQLLRGVAACHKAGVLHRDLKPSNLLIGPDGMLKIADFGSARILLPEEDSQIAAAAAAAAQELPSVTKNRNIRIWLEGGTDAEKKLKLPSEADYGKSKLSDEDQTQMIHKSFSYDRLEITPEDGSAASEPISPRVSDLQAESLDEEEGSEWWRGSSAAAVKDDYGGALTDCVGTRWYKAPELLYGSTNYSVGVDLWAVGCIFGELLQGEVIFPGASDIDQLSRVVRVLGVPNETTWPGVSELPDHDKICFNDDRPPVTIEKQVHRASKSARKLLEKFLVYPPASRVSAEDALRDEYFRNFEPPSSKLQSVVVNKETLDAWLGGGRSS